MTYMINLNEIIEDVRECDRRLIKWLKTKGSLSSDDYYLVHRPDLVKIRVWVMSKLGIVDIDESGNVTLIREPPDLNVLPINSDLIEYGLKKPYLFYLIYMIIRDYKPRTISDITKIFNKIVGTSHDKRSIALVIWKMGDYYVKQYREDRRNARFIERAKAKRSG